MDANFISRNEQKEFAKRMDEENNRLSKRLTLVEEMSLQINELALQIKELTLSVKNLAERQVELNEQEKELNERLDNIEDRDGEKWRNVTFYCLTAIIGAVIGYFFNTLSL